MWSKNKKAATRAESDHLQRVKELPCVICDAPGPSEAHHIDQALQWTCIPLCSDCHRGGVNGIHGQRRIWSVVKHTELSALNETLRRLFDGRA